MKLPNPESKAGYRKMHLCMEQAIKDGLAYCWVDTCCINKESSAELQEAIKSMFRWYREAKVCYAYLDDVLVVGEGRAHTSKPTERTSEVLIQASVDDSILGAEENPAQPENLVMLMAAVRTRSARAESPTPHPTT